MNAGDLAIEHGDFEKASEEYKAAQTLAPEIVEIPFWHAVTLVGSDRADDALPIFHEVFRREPRWRELIPRLVDAGLLPDDRSLLRRILEDGD
jgi:predicted Zn-dependent protease